ncbi:extracellular solute-binding protein [Paenibacillus agricola]|uniref:Extracellular solute-binding protein n=1 Tax=Paenibacillus agricola TaxID=2716264 RepID=A0ABX0JDT2_9BACL|nr:extracellular solute-binding protein [Paenibacillus agricola]NHN33723.1 extracellular solute-binding protein [Paenibacillus agricola]
MKAFKKSLVVSIGLCMMLTLVLAGCTTENQDAESSKNTNIQEKTKDATKEVANDGPLEPFAKPVTISVMREDNPSIWFPAGETIKANILTKFYEEKLNIKWDVKWLVERGRSAERLDLAIASNDIPDMFEANSAQVYKLMKAGQIQPLGEVYKKYASNNIKESFGFNNGLFFKPVTFGGEVYGLPATQDYAGGIQLIWVRQDWLDKLGLKAPKTIDELHKVAKAFVDNKMGGENTIGIGMQNDLGLVLDAFAHAYNVYPDTWLPNKNGELVYGDTEPGMKNVLQTMQKFYKDKLFDPEFAVKNGDKVTEDVAAGRIGLIFYPFWGSLGPPMKNKQNQPGAEWAAYPIMTNPEGQYKIKNKSSTSKWLVVKKGFEHPEAAVKQYNLWYELWQGQYSSFYHGNNQQAYNKAQEDFKYYPPFWFDPPMKNQILDENLREVIASGDTSKLKSEEAKKKYPLMMDPNSIYGWTEKLVATQSYKIIQEQLEKNLVYSAFQGPTTPGIAAKKPLADKARLEGLVKFIMGEPLDNFDVFVDKWNKSGGKELSTEVNAWYKENK